MYGSLKIENNIYENVIVQSALLLFVTQNATAKLEIVSISHGHWLLFFIPWPSSVPPNFPSLVLASNCQLAASTLPPPVACAQLATQYCGVAIEGRPTVCRAPSLLPEGHWMKLGSHLGVYHACGVTTTMMIGEMPDGQEWDIGTFSNTTIFHRIQRWLCDSRHYCVYVCFKTSLWLYLISPYIVDCPLRCVSWTWTT